MNLIVDEFIGEKNQPFNYLFLLLPSVLSPNSYFRIGHCERNVAFSKRAKHPRVPLKKSLSSCERFLRYVLREQLATLGAPLSTIFKSDPADARKVPVLGNSPVTGSRKPAMPFGISILTVTVRMDTSKCLASPRIDSNEGSSFFAIDTNLSAGINNSLAI